MLEVSVGPDVIAAHEAGHVIVGLHLRMATEGVDLVERDGSPARTRFAKGEMSGLRAEDRAALAFSGLAGQLFAGTYWSQIHVRGDVNWFLGGEQPNGNQGLVSARRAIKDDALLFQRVRLNIFQALATGADFLSLEDLLGWS